MSGHREHFGAQPLQVGEAKRHKQDRDKAPQTEIKSHNFRRTFGTWFLQANPGLARELAELMSHSDHLSQVMKYTLSDEK